MKEKSIQTTGELREFLLDTMIEVRFGNLDLDKAARLTKLATQVNESIYAEIKASKLRAEAGETLPRLGDIFISNNKEAA